MEPAINASNYKHYLSKYSNLVTSGMRMNNFLELKLSNQQQVLLRLKTLLIKYASLNSDKKDMSSELKRDIIDWNEIFKENNAKLQSDITNLKLKVIINTQILLIVNRASILRLVLLLAIPKSIRE